MFASRRHPHRAALIAVACALGALVAPACTLAITGATVVGTTLLAMGPIAVGAYLTRRRHRAH